MILFQEELGWTVYGAEHAPFLAALRYKESGLRKRAQWERVWDQQREEDRTGERLDIKVPPKYSGADFLRHSYWSNRGKLDVPKERFIYLSRCLHRQWPLLAPGLGRLEPSGPGRSPRQPHQRSC